MSETATTGPVGARVRQYIVDNFLYMRPGFEFSDDDFLMGKGIIDSLGVMELIGFIEEAFGVSVADEDVTEENLGSINAIARYLAKHQGGAGAARA